MAFTDDTEDINSFALNGTVSSFPLKLLSEGRQRDVRFRRKICPSFFECVNCGTEVSTQDSALTSSSCPLVRSSCSRRWSPQEVQRRPQVDRSTRRRNRVHH